MLRNVPWIYSQCGEDGRNRRLMGGDCVSDCVSRPGLLTSCPNHCLKMETSVYDL